MATTTKGWQECLTRLCESTEEFDHWLGEFLTSADDDSAWTMLTAIIIDDPATTHEYQVAARTLCRFSERVAA